MGGRYLGRKLAQAFATIVAIVVLNFLLFRLMPGSPERVLFRNPNLSPAVVAAARVRWGLDKPLIPDQLVGVRRVDDDRRPRLLVQVPRPGRDRRHRRPGRPTVLLVGLGELVSIVVGLGLGSYAGWRRGGRVDRVGNGISLILYSMPYFVIGMPLIIIFAAGSHWFPTSGMQSVGGGAKPFLESMIDLGSHLALPLTTVVAGAHRRVLDPDALVDHRDALGGLHHDGPGQGPDRRPDPALARLPERAAADGHPDRDQPRVRHRRRDHGRGRLQLAGPRHADRVARSSRATTRSCRGSSCCSPCRSCWRTSPPTSIYGFLDPRVRT